MASDACKAWRAEHLLLGRRIEPVAQLFAHGPTRWGAFDDSGKEWHEVSAFVTVPLRPEMDQEVPTRVR